MTKSLQDQLDTGVRLIRTDQIDAASTLAGSLRKQYPDSQEVLLFAADTASLSGDLKGAIATLEEVPQTADNCRVLLRKAQLLFNDFQRTTALKTARAVADIDGTDERQLRAVARILSDCQDPEGAHKVLVRAHDMAPQSALILFDLAVAEFHLNLPEDAEQHIGTLLQLAPLHPGALHLRSALSKQTPERNHVEDLQGRLAQEPNSPNLATAVGYALAKEYEDLEQYDASFTALNQGAKAYRGTLNYNSRQELTAHEEIRTGFTREVFSTLEPGPETKGPIFIVGLPRTGTTLVERLLSSHSQVSSIGEFRDFPLLLRNLAGRLQPEVTAGMSDVEASLAVDFHELGTSYLAAAGQLAGGSPYFVDKLPFNFLYCGYIAAALPGARIIQLTRDPLDSCYALYKTLFFGAYSYSYDLVELADYFISYHHQMRHWHQVLPNRILDVGYEQLVQDPEAEARRIVEWCGLSWEETVLDFHKQDSPSMTASAMQVRRPINTDSIGSWKRAGNSFDPVREKLLHEGLIEA